MRKISIALAVLAMLAVAAGRIGRAQAQVRGAGAPAGQAAPAARGRGTPPTAVFSLEDNFLKWRLLPGEQAYEAVDGKHLLQYVNDLAAVSRHYRDAGHPQFWGRIIGSSADREEG
jgi:hypothetical protein